MKKNSKKIQVKGIEIVTFIQNRSDYISLTDIAKSKNTNDPRFVIQNWMRTRFSLEFLGLWEQMNNPRFNRVEFDTFKNESGSNSFTMTPQKWIDNTNAVGIISKAGRYGGTYAHKDIAFEFASWISAEFKLYLIKEFQRLKEEENERRELGWDLRRNLAAMNYHIHTDAIKAHLIPPQISSKQASFVYADEADVLNKALFGLTAKEWRSANPNKEGNIRDYANVYQLICLTNLESLNAELIRQDLSQQERLKQLNQTAINQMKSLLKSPAAQRLASSSLSSVK